MRRAVVRTPPLMCAFPVKIRALTVPARLNVSSGTFTATVPARSALALHTGALGTGNSTSSTGTGGSGSVTVNFQETATTTFGEVRCSLSC